MTSEERRNEITHQKVRIKAIERRIRLLPEDSKALPGLRLSLEEAWRTIERLERG